MRRLRAKLVCKGESTPAEPPTKLVFVTNQTYASDFGAANGALDGDAICQRHADDAGLVGTFMAWVSDSTTSPSTRFTRSTDPYVLVDGTRVADDWLGLTSGGTLSPIGLDEFGAAPPLASVISPDFRLFWSGTDGNGMMIGSGSGLLALTWFDWSYSGSDRSSGALGNWSVSGAPWTAWLAGRGVLICDGLAPLACFQQ